VISLSKGKYLKFANKFDRALSHV
jgi:hypothetical protein